jgi:hypothetical protein
MRPDTFGLTLIDPQRQFQQKRRRCAVQFFFAFLAR